MSIIFSKTLIDVHLCIANQVGGCLGLAGGYVGSLYIWRGAAAASRDKPEVCVRAHAHSAISVVSKRFCVLNFWHSPRHTIMHADNQETDAECRSSHCVVACLHWVFYELVSSILWDALCSWTPTNSWGSGNMYIYINIYNHIYIYIYTYIYICICIYK